MFEKATRREFIRTAAGGIAATWGGLRIFAGPQGLKFTFTLFGPAGTVGMDVISRYIRELMATTGRASELLDSDQRE